MNSKTTGQIMETVNINIRLQTNSGIITTCAKCGKVRINKSNWFMVEDNLEKRSDVQISHGLCPGCIQTLYPDYIKKQRF